ncbi:hypothetical protein [Nocardia sp. IFM 10818]
MQLTYTRDWLRQGDQSKLYLAEIYTAETKYNYEVRNGFDWTVTVKDGANTVILGKSWEPTQAEAERKCEETIARRHAIHWS